jgi:hypothetical protein
MKLEPLAVMLENCVSLHRVLWWCLFSLASAIKPAYFMSLTVIHWVLVMHKWVIEDHLQLRNWKQNISVAPKTFPGCQPLSGHPWFVFKSATDHGESRRQRDRDYMIVLVVLKAWLWWSHAKWRCNVLLWLSAGYYAGCLPVHVEASLTCIAFQLSSYTKQHSFSHKVSKSVWNSWLQL